VSQKQEDGGNLNINNEVNMKNIFSELRTKV
jgi:hypothetical protein